MLFLLEGKRKPSHSSGVPLTGRGRDGTRGLVHLLRRTLPEVVGIPYVCLTRGSEAQRGGEDVVSADICTPAVHRVKKKKKKGVGVRATRLGSRHGSTRL